MNIFRTIASLLVLLSSVAQATGDDLNPSDVVGAFANTGHVGPYANTKTVTQAHLACLNQTNRGEEAYSSGGASGDVHGDYKGCMADYVPFKITGSDSAGACSSQSVTWGQCSATVPAMREGQVGTVSNIAGDGLFEGYASFQCSGGQVEFQAGGCSRSVKACEDGEVVDWPVTFPLWADEDASTIALDKYGLPRHTPKGRCVASMPKTDSGVIKIATPTAALMADLGRPMSEYDAGSSAPKRCFDADWLDEPEGGVSSCTYIPKSCKAKTHAYNGCEFELPNAPHDTIHISAKPTPVNSIGATEAYCWDGEWEVKAQACNKSCAGSIPAHDWTGVDTRACGHDAVSYSERQSPGTLDWVANEVEGMTGTSGKVCNDGVWSVSGETCLPLDCTFAAGNSWAGDGGALCSHADTSSGGWAHNTTFHIDHAGGALSGATGRISYRCEYGEIQQTAGSCLVMAGQTCISEEVVIGGAETDPDPTEPTPFDPREIDVCRQLGMMYEGGLCCMVNSRHFDPYARCYQIP
jgi:hypothetical protein